MGVLQEPFKKYVKEQIHTRQTLLGQKSNISDDTLAWSNANSPWLRLSSSVNLTNKLPKNSKLNPKNTVLQKLLSSRGKNNKPLFEEDSLAKNFILSGGTLTPDSNPASGLNESNKIFSGAYGWGSLDERGFVPMPGITNISVQNLSKGALTRSTINIKCFSRQQLELIDILYLRPGYSLLLEFGWSVYMDNNGNLQSFDGQTKPFTPFMNPDKTKTKTDQYKIYDLIQEEKEDRFGNYEAVYGKITNFNWTFNKDGSYDCTVQLSGFGDVIENLTLNVSQTAEESLEISENENTSTKSSSIWNDFLKYVGVVKKEDTNYYGDLPVIAEANKTILHEKLYNLYKGMSKSTNVFEEKEDESKFALFTQDLTYSNFDDQGNLVIKNGAIKIDNVITNLSTTRVNATQVYIKFASLLAYVQKFFLPYSNSGKTPLTKFEMDFRNLDKDKNFIFKFPGQFSSNPLNVLTPYKDLPEGILDIAEKEGVLPYTRFNEELGKISNWEEETYIGKLGEVYLNVNHIIETLNTSTNSEDNSISLISFLKAIVNSITKSLGGVNQIQIQAPDGFIKFTENIPQRFSTELYKDSDYARFNLFGVTPTDGKVDTTNQGEGGSFIRDIKLNAEIPDAFKTIITYGAQINGNSISENATAFSHYNLGLQDRIVPEKNFYSIADEKEPSKRLIQLFEQRIDQASNTEGTSNATTLFQLIYGGQEGDRALQFTKENIDVLESLNGQYSNLVFGELTNLNQVKAPFFLPYNLNLTMDGLSGMVLFQKFRMDDKVLPLSYQDDVIDVVITALNHTVSVSDWVTSIETISSPKFPLEPITATGTAPKRNLPAPEETIGEEEFKNFQFNSPFPGSRQRKDAARKAWNYVFVDNDLTKSWKNGMCARGVRNLAEFYVDFLKQGKVNTNRVPRQGFFNGGGNANQKSFWNTLLRRGYRQHQILGNAKKSTILNTVDKLTKNSLNEVDDNFRLGPGDILVYWAEKSPTGKESFRRYGHVQMFMGSEVISTGFSTDNKTNYNTDFVYKSKQGEEWSLYIFIAPGSKRDLRF